MKKASKRGKRVLFETSEGARRRLLMLKARYDLNSVGSVVNALLDYFDEDRFKRDCGKRFDEPIRIEEPREVAKPVVEPKRPGPPRKNGRPVITDPEKAERRAEMKKDMGLV